MDAVSELKSKKHAVVIVVEQPPLFSTVYSISTLRELHDKITIAIRDSNQVISSESVVKMYRTIFYDKTKYNVVLYKDDILNSGNLDDELKGDVIYVLDPKLYVTIRNKCHLNVTLLQTVAGYDEIFHKIAFIRSMRYQLVVKGNDIWCM